jgi:hypothetical protein
MNDTLFCVLDKECDLHVFPDIAHASLFAAKHGLTVDIFNTNDGNVEINER